MSKQIETLEGLRGEIDEIDDALQDLLIRRAEVSHAIAKVKQPASVQGNGTIAPALRPAREAAILRRLIARHRGDLPPRVREALHERVQEQLPEIVHGITDEIGENIDQLLDIKLMVIHHLEKQPELANRIFTEVGQRELRLPPLAERRGRRDGRARPR